MDTYRAGTPSDPKTPGTEAASWMGPSPLIEICHHLGVLSTGEPNGESDNAEIYLYNREDTSWK